MSLVPRFLGAVTAGRGRLMISVIAISLAIVGAISATSPVLAQSPATRSIVAFNQAESDRTVEAFVLRYNLRAEALYLWTAGFTGSHRDYASSTPAALLATGRRESVKLFTNAIGSGLQNMARFVNSHTEADLLASAALTTEARSILNNQAQLKVALAAARGEAPLVYALEVVGASPDELAALSRDPLVSAVATRDGPKTAGLLKPAPYQLAQKDPVLAGLDSRQIYAQVRALAQSGRE